MRTIQERLASHPFLQGVSTDNIKLLAEDAVPKVFEKGDMLFRQGDKAIHLFLIEKGTVEIGLFKSKRWNPVIITYIHKGENLGWSWMFPPYQHKFDGRAKTRIVALALEGKPVVAKMGHYPLLGYELAMNIAHSLTKALHATRIQLIHIHHKTSMKNKVAAAVPLVLDGVK